MYSIIQAIKDHVPTEKLMSELTSGNAFIDEKDSRGHSVLLYAIEGKREPVADYLVEKGIGFTEATFYTSCISWMDKYVKLHLEAGFDCNKQFNGYDLLHTAFAALDRNGRKEIANLHAIADMLIASGADINSRSGELMQSSLHLASYYARHELIEKLIANNADVSLKDKNGYTALHHTCLGGRDTNAYVVQQLVKANADINAQDNYGFTPLHLAVMYYCYDEVVLLKHFGANLSIRTTKPRRCSNKKLNFEITLPAGLTAYEMTTSRYLGLSELRMLLQ